MEKRMDEKSLRVRQICLRCGLTISDAQFDLLSRFVGGLLEWNRAINVISRKDQENVWYGHILHSLSLLFILEIPEGSKLLDLGSGGGLPGIPIAIVRPDLEITLLDSITKKTKVMEDLRIKLGLSRVKVKTGRAEEVGREKGERGQYDLVVARAVAPLVDLIKWSGPFLRGGKFSVHQKGKRENVQIAALKGGDLSAEITEARIKTPVSFIETIPIIFDGSVEIGLEEKKLVIVHR
jgi:16S rRNA (guanine527-N7)-methyltransferase